MRFYRNQSTQPAASSLTENAGGERHVLDATERRMVELLQHDGRLPVAWLAKELSVTEVTARRKLRGLQARGIIRIVATVDPFDVGYETPVIIGLKVQRNRVDEVAERLSRLDQVRYVGASTGRVDLIIEVVTRTNQDLASFLMNELAAIDGITDSETNLIIRIYKQSWDWAIRAGGERDGTPESNRPRPRHAG
jgi:Lrp/AsnC family transcriptional regulator for asnA, asnC and gidA